MSRVLWFEIPVQDLTRAAQFYGRVFDVALEEAHDEGQRLALFPEHDGEGAPGALVQCSGAPAAGRGARVYFASPDVEATLARVEASGGRVLHPVVTMPGHGCVAEFMDTEGNRVAVATSR